MIDVATELYEFLQKQDEEQTLLKKASLTEKLESGHNIILALTKVSEKLDDYDSSGELSRKLLNVANTVIKESSDKNFDNDEGDDNLSDIKALMKQLEEEMREFELEKDYESLEKEPLDIPTTPHATENLYDQELAEELEPDPSKAESFEETPELGDLMEKLEADVQDNYDMQLATDSPKYHPFYSAGRTNIFKTDNGYLVKVNELEGKDSQKFVSEDSWLGKVLKTIVDYESSNDKNYDMQFADDELNDLDALEQELNTFENPLATQNKSKQFLSQENVDITNTNNGYIVSVDGKEQMVYKDSWLGELIASLQSQNMKESDLGENEMTPEGLQELLDAVETDLEKMTHKDVDISGDIEEHDSDWED